MRRRLQYAQPACLCRRGWWRAVVVRLLRWKLKCLAAPERGCLAALPAANAAPTPAAAAAAALLEAAALLQDGQISAPRIFSDVCLTDHV